MAQVHRTERLVGVVRVATCAFRRRYEQLAGDPSQLAELRRLHYEVIRTYVEGQSLLLHCQHQMLARLRGDSPVTTAERARSVSLHDDIQDLHRLSAEIASRIAALEGRPQRTS